MVNGLRFSPRYRGACSTIWSWTPAPASRCLYPTSNDTTILGELVGEGQPVSSQDVSIGQIILAGVSLPRTWGPWAFGEREPES